MKKTIIRGYAILLFAAILYGTYGVWSRLMGDSFGPFYQAWVRSLLIMLIMTPFMLATKSFKKVKRKDWPAFGVFIAFCVFTQAPLYYAFNNAPIGTVQFIFYSMFVITAYFVGRFYLGEKITKIKYLSVILAFIGLLLVFGTAALTFAPLGLALAALNGIASGGEVSSSKKVENEYSPALIVFWGWVFTLLTHLPISLIHGETQVTVQASQPWLWLSIYSVVNAAAFWLSIVGFRYVDASIGSLIGLMEVVFAVILGAIIFNEVLAPTVYLGGLLVITAAMLPDLMELITRRKALTVIDKG